MQSLWSAVQRGYMRVIAPVADWLVARRVRPNTITTIGTICTCTAGVIFASGHISAGGWFLGLTALFDVLDGNVARRTGQSTVFGAFYDSTLDRVGDGATFIGIAAYLLKAPGVALRIETAVVCMIAILSSLLVSYARARAEGLGLDCKVGIVQRAERMIMIGVPSLIVGAGPNGIVLQGLTVVLAILSTITVVQRFVYVYQVTEGTPGPK